MKTIFSLYMREVGATRWYPLNIYPEKPTALKLSEFVPIEITDDLLSVGITKLDDTEYYLKEEELDPLRP